MTYPNLLDRFLTYVKVNTRSDEHSTTTPSTQSQVDFATNVLIPEMKRVGLQNVYYLPNGFAIGTLPSPTWILLILMLRELIRKSLKITMVELSTWVILDLNSILLISRALRNIQAKRLSQLMARPCWVLMTSQGLLKL